MSKKRTITVITLLLAIALAGGTAVVAGASRDGATATTPMVTPDWIADTPTDSTIGVDHGFIEAGEAISPFADDLPAIANLEPALRAAMQAAARAAINDDVEFVVTSGWRSADYQQKLLDDAILEYGSVEAAGEFVLSPDDSAHVTGEAVDIGRTDANSWLSQHGADYGLCQTYANEMWHFELATTPGGRCPPQLPNAHSQSAT
jgi:D-alanyl-D-alanine carboxypeptidase